jgi:methylmalonyl-CoA/ethylmalonyl-CoA epimerase
LGLGYARETPDFVDPGLGIMGRFLIGQGVRLELLVEVEGSGVLRPWLRNGTTIYHQAFLVSSLEEAIGRLSGELGAKLVRGPIPAVAFDGRMVAFLMLPGVSLIELIEMR